MHWIDNKEDLCMHVADVTHHTTDEFFIMFTLCGLLVFTFMTLHSLH